jgi:hypothetical protein
MSSRICVGAVRRRESLEPVYVDSIDQRMQSFVEWRGEVPLSAKRLEDFDARQHAATWIRHNIGKGVAGAYVICYAVEAMWWSYFFARVESCAPEGAEVWSIEAYNHEGSSWIGRFYYWPDVPRWRHVPPLGPSESSGHRDMA